jgi:LPXTG-motif cell wall-anchored protein
MNFLASIVSTGGLLGIGVVIFLFIVPTALINIFICEGFIRPKTGKDATTATFLLVLGLLVSLIFFLFPYKTSSPSPENGSKCYPDSTGQYDCDYLYNDSVDPNDYINP